MNLSQVLDRLQEISQYTGHDVDVIAEEEHPRGEGLTYDIADIETDGGQIVVKLV